MPSWGAKIAFGETVTVSGQEVIPAALVMFGFGGGGGSGKWPEREAVPEGEGEGSGGGGGGYVLPIGAYVRGPDGMKFRPNPVAMIVVSVPLVSAVGWAVARIITAVNSGRATN
ncbi:spore germination protein GerW family protein [Promicromonospora sp. NPDC090134]|uniref:spore germination protein GerW family protein n=1 Tax=Promicromonospora sp. NPDC090134 TaxID=3364408 RepID=UPI003814EAB5